MQSVILLNQDIPNQTNINNSDFQQKIVTEKYKNPGVYKENWKQFGFTDKNDQSKIVCNQFMNF
jgi:hypothetical protein